MNTDIRIDVKLPRHRKFKRLRRMVGPTAMENLICFWTTVAEQRPNGVLNGWSNEDIEDVAGWEGEPGVFVRGMLEAKFLIETPNGYAPKDWEEHQPWAVNGEQRKAAARKAGKASAAARKAQKGTAQPLPNGSRTTTKNSPNEAKTESRKNQDVTQRKSNNPERSVRTFDRTPSPSPSPSPSPLKTKGEESSYEDSCSEQNSEPTIEVLPPEGGSVIQIPLVGGEAHHVPQSDIDQWTQLFPAVDVLQELRKAAAWSDANPKRRKTKSGIKAFLVNWLSREQDRGGAKNNAGRAATTTDRNREEFRRYMEGR